MNDRIRHSKIDHDELKDRIVKQYEPAMLNCLALGYGFIVLRRVRGCNTFSASHMSWSEVKDVLEELGALGPLGGDQNKKIRKKAPESCL